METRCKEVRDDKTETRSYGRDREGETPQNIRRQLHSCKADISEAEGRTEELTEQRQRVLHLPLNGREK